MSAQSYTLADRPIVCAITIPVDGAAATLESLVAAVASLLAGKQVLSAEIQQHAANFNWGHAANACAALASTGTALLLPCLRIDQVFVESTGGATVAAVAVLWVDSN